MFVLDKQQRYFLGIEGHNWIGYYVFFKEDYPLIKLRN
jgi:hypothetical protein